MAKIFCTVILNENISNQPVLKMTSSSDFGGFHNIMISSSFSKPPPLPSPASVVSSGAEFCCHTTTSPHLGRPSDRPCAVEAGAPTGPVLFWSFKVQKEQPGTTRCQSFTLVFALKIPPRQLLLGMFQDLFSSLLRCLVIPT